jgi:hypothetical protein
MNVQVAFSRPRPPCKEQTIIMQGKDEFRNFKYVEARL